LPEHGFWGQGERESTEEKGFLREGRELAALMRYCCLRGTKGVEGAAESSEESCRNRQERFIDMHESMASRVWKSGTARRCGVFGDFQL
jgi:hypothetical protein